ncbi:protein required for normal CLN1 and CLN2 G1 cyclin expression [Dinochytrium kinnereticum]|nr:protein required for normal CLN1 and CLN2 G1 cyclin expression [Dinochytrium kinnereticum]
MTLVKREYYNIGMKIDFERVLRTAAKVGAAGMHSRDPHYCEVLYTLASYYIEVAKEMHDTSKALIDGGEQDFNAIVQLATEFVNKADQIDSKNIWIIIAKDMKPDVRVAIGVCYYRLQMIPEARKCFDRALEIDGRNDDALVSLAILDWNEARLKNSEMDLRAVAQKLNDAFEINPLNPLTLLLMGERSLFAKDFEKQSNSRGLRSDAYAFKAKALHSQGLYRESLDYYLKAVDGNQSSPVHQFGLGEVYIFLGREIEKACECLEKVLLREPDNYDSLMKLASLYSLSEETHSKALKCFTKLQQLFGIEDKNKLETNLGLISEPFAQVELACIYEARDPKVALSGYLNAIELFKSTSKPVPAEVYNNIGTLYFLSGANLEKAEEYFQKGLEEEADNGIAQESSITLMYNLARFKEDKGDWESAEKLHNLILAKHPTYVDSRLRLAQSMILKGKVKEGREMITRAIEMDGKAVSAFLLLGSSFYEDKSSKANLKEARKVFEDRELHSRRAFEFFDKALRLDSKNAYAAAGIGISLVEVGRLSQAREVLSQIQEGATNMPTISLNLAHILVELGQTKAAVTLYEKVLKRFYENRSSHIFQCLSRAYYIVAKSTKDPSAMLKSLEYIQKAVKLEPSKSALWFDLALVKQQYAQVLNDQPIDKRSLSLLQKAMNGLEISRKFDPIFTSLAERADGQHYGYDIKHARERASYCKDVSRMSEKKIHETGVLEKQKEERLKAIKEDQMKLALEKDEKDRMLREAEERNRAEIEKKRRELMQRVQSDNEKLREQEHLDEQKKSSKRIKDDIVSDGEGHSDGNDGEEKKTKRQKPSKPRQPKRKRVMGSSDEDEPKESKELKRASGKQSNLSKEFVDSDEDMGQDS